VRQKAIRERCFHPTGTFVPFPRPEIDVKQRGLAGLADLIAHEGITIYNSVASTFREFASGLGDERFPRLRLIKVMGEALYPRDIELYRRHFAPPRVLITCSWTSAATRSSPRRSPPRSRPRSRYRRCASSPRRPSRR
jgi:hypothetical protein